MRPKSSLRPRTSGRTLWRNSDHWHSEFARVFGIEFFSVISRGSQFKVESFMFRIGKPESFVFISPSKGQVRLQHFAKAVLNS